MRGRCRAVLFDVDGTLYQQAPLRVAMASELGLAPWLRHRPDVVPMVWRVLRTFRRVREELRTSCTPPERLADVQYTRTAAALAVDEIFVRRVVDEWMYRRPLKYLPLVRRPGAAAALAACRERGWLVGVFSDYPTEAKVRALGLERLVSVHVCACDDPVNAFKPDPAGFLYACSRLGIPPEDVAYVGDRPDVDAAGAVAAGLRAIIIGRTASPDGTYLCARSMPAVLGVIERAFESGPVPAPIVVQES